MMTAYTVLQKIAPVVTMVTSLTVVSSHGQNFSHSNHASSSAQQSVSFDEINNGIQSVTNGLKTGKTIGAIVGGTMGGVTGAAIGAVAGSLHDNRQASTTNLMSIEGDPNRFKTDESLGFSLPVIDPGQLNHAQRVTVHGRAHIIDGNVEGARQAALSDALYNAAMKQNVELTSNSIMTDGALQSENMMMRSKSAILEHRVLEEKQEHGLYVLTLEAIIADPYSTQVCTNAGLRKTVSLYKIRVRSAETVDANHLGTVRKSVQQLLPTLQSHQAVRLLNRTSHRFDEKQFNLALGNMLYEDLATAGGKVERRGMIITGDVVVRGNRHYKNMAKEKFLDVGINLKLIDANDLKIRSQYTQAATIRTERVPVTMKWYMNQEVGKGNEEIKTFMSNVFQKMLGDIECAPLQTRITMIKGQDIYLNVGQDSGVRQGQMLFVPEQTAPAQMRADLPMGKDWRMMEVVRVDTFGAVARMIEKEKTSQVKVGYKVQFLN